MPSLPDITSSLIASSIVHNPFSYQITATHSPTSFSAVHLPPGLLINTTTGTVSGRSTGIGVWKTTIGAANANGGNTAILVITITAQMPHRRQPDGGIVMSEQQKAIFQKLKCQENSTELKIQYMISQLPEHAALLLNEEYQGLYKAITEKEIAQYTTSKYWLIRQWAEERLAILGHYMKCGDIWSETRFPMTAWQFINRFSDERKIQ